MSSAHQEQNQNLLQMASLAFFVCAILTKVAAVSVAAVLICFDLLLEHIQKQKQSDVSQGTAALLPLLHHLPAVLAKNALALSLGVIVVAFALR